MAKTGDSAGVWFPPPLIFLGFLMIGLGADRWIGLDGFGLDPGLRLMAGGVLLVSGLAIDGMAALGFRRARTGIAPWTPSTAIVARGLHLVSRNPMYLGMAVTQAGLAVLFDNVLAFVLVVASLACVRAFVIPREEAYLQAKFGESYTAYKARVPRWL